MLLRTSRHVLGPDPSGLLLSGVSTYQATVLGIAASNLLAYWPLTETSGTTASDVSGNARHGTYNGVTLAQIAGPGPSMGSAPLFDGVNDYVNIFSASLATVYLPRSYTLILWTKAITAASKALWYTTTGTFENNMSMTATQFSYFSTVGNRTWLATVTDWHCLGVTMDYANTRLRVFMDGVQIGADITPSADPGTSTLTTASITRVGNYAHMYAQHMAMWNIPLSLSQMQTLATAR